MRTKKDTPPASNVEPTTTATAYEPDACPAHAPAKDTREWVFKPDVPRASSVHSEAEFLSDPRLYEAVLSSIQDGISILDTELNIIYINKSMEKWYPGILRRKGKKCYKSFHHSDEPCAPCPAVRAISTVSPQTELVPYEGKGKDLGWQKLYAVPVVNDTGEVVLVIEYIRDITFQMRAESDKDHMAELYENLEAQNEMLMEIIDQRAKYENDLAGTVNENLEKYVKPALGYLKKSMQARDYKLIEAIVDEMVLPVTKHRSSPLEKLSPRELQVATMIREGYSSKEIAATLFLSKKTVDFHRGNIRTKLGLRDENLRVFLATRA